MPSYIYIYINSAWPIIYISNIYLIYIYIYMRKPGAGGGGGGGPRLPADHFLELCQANYIYIYLIYIYISNIYI